jgi:hypothetical protein
LRDVLFCLNLVLRPIVDDGRSDQKQSCFQIYSRPAPVRLKRNRGQHYSIKQLRNCFHKNIGCYFYFSSIGDLPVQTVSILGYLEPLSALFFAAAFLGESLSYWQWIGAALILGGAAFGELFRPKQTLSLPASGF